LKTKGSKLKEKVTKKEEEKTQVTKYRIHCPIF